MQCAATQGRDHKKSERGRAIETPIISLSEGGAIELPGTTGLAVFRLIEVTVVAEMVFSFANYIHL